MASAHSASSSGAPAVSVIIPCFNHGNFVADALSSVLRQTCDNLEVIVVEGGSTDGSTREQVRELESWGDPRVRILYRDQPSPLGSNRNFGIQYARGRYVCCLDADDRLERPYLDVATFLLEERGYDIVSSAIRVFGDEDRRVGTLTHPVLSDLLKINWITSAAVFRHALYDDAGGYQDAGFGSGYIFEDWRLWVRMAALGARIANIPEPLLLYRAHSGPRLSQDPALPGYGAQRRAVARLNEDVLTRAARRRSRQLRATEIRAGDEHTYRVTSEANRSGGLLIVEDEPTKRPRSLTPTPEFPTDRRRTVIVSSSRPSPGPALAAEESSQVEYFALRGLLRQQDWRDFCSYLIGTKGLTALSGTEKGGGGLLADLHRLHPMIQVISPDQLSPAQP